MKLAAGAIVCCALAMVAVGTNVPRPSSTAAPHAPSEDPADLFYEALLRAPGRRLESRRALMHAVLRNDPQARHILLLGLNELWLAAENQPDGADGFVHALLARHWLRRAEAVLPEDTRIPSWRWAAEWSVAAAEHDDAAMDDARGKLLALAEQDPCFHAVTLGIISFDHAPGSPEYKAAHAAMEAAFRCANDTPSIQDRPRWPHNVHAFLVALADFRLKAGDVRGAEGALVIAEARPGFNEWGHRRAVTDRLDTLNARRDRFANEDPTDDPAFFFERGGPASCRGCHEE